MYKMKYEYVRPYKGERRDRCVICGKRRCDSIDNIGTLCHWNCLELSEAPE